MWDGGGNYGYWPMHQSAYSNLPTDQVDWAMLAKQWIAQRGMVGIGPPDYLQPPGPAPLPPFPPVKPEPPAGPIGEVSSAVGGIVAQSHPQSIISCDMENSNSQDSNYYPSSEPEQAPAEGWGNWNGAAMPAWAVPPPPPPMDEAHDNATNEMQYGGDGSQFMGPPFGFNQPPEDMYMGPYEHAGFPQFWNQGPMPGQPMMAQKPFIPVRENLEYRAAPKRGGVRAPWPAMGDIPPLMDDSGIDAAKRRHLPLWIREGLEKMEREKQRQMEKERHEQALLDAKKAREEAQKDGADQDDPQTVVKSIFDSDDEESAPEPSITHQQPISRSSKESVANERKRSPSPIKRQAEEEEEEEEDEPMTEEEKLAHMMLKVRQMMTEVFLEVTNREMADVAQTVYAAEKRKQARAPARQLAKSTALDSLTSLGLGYGSESSDEDGSDNERRLPNEESDDTDDDGVLRQRILQKKADFERKMQELEETERENEIEKRRHAEEHLKPQRNDRNAESNDEVQVSIADSDEAPSRKDKETTGKRVKQIEEKTKKDEKRAPERSRSDKKERSKKEDEEEETSEEVSESGSDSSSESQSGSSDDSSSSSSRKSSAESKELNRRRIKSQLSDGAKERRKEKSDTGRKKTDEQDSKAIRQESVLSRKDGEKLRSEKRVEEYQKEESHSRKKSSRHHSAEKIEYDKADQKRRRPTKDHERGRADRTEDKDRTRGHKDSRGHGKRSRDDRSRSEDDDRRDYPSKTYDNEDRTHRSQRKKARRSRSSSQSSHEHYRLRRSHDKESSPHDQRRSVKDRRLSDQNREHRTSRDRGQQLSRDRRSPKDRDRRSSRDRDRQSSRDRDRRKETKDRSGKKDRARGRSRSHSRSDDS